MKGMGWNKGEGLGNNAQGSTEYIRAQKKADNAGVHARRLSGDERCRHRCHRDQRQYVVLGGHLSLLAHYWLIFGLKIGDVFNNVLQKLNKPASERGQSAVTPAAV